MNAKKNNYNFIVGCRADDRARADGRYSGSNDSHRNGNGHHRTSGWRASRNGKRHACNHASGDAESRIAHPAKQRNDDNAANSSKPRHREFRLDSQRIDLDPEPLK